MSDWSSNNERSCDAKYCTRNSIFTHFTIQQYLLAFCKYAIYATLITTLDKIFVQPAFPTNINFQIFYKSSINIDKYMYILFLYSEALFLDPISVQNAASSNGLVDLSYPFYKLRFRLCINAELLVKGTIIIVITQLLSFKISMSCLSLYMYLSLPLATKHKFD